MPPPPPALTGVRFQVMNAEVLEFPDASFDLVFGVAILHHLDLDTACAEFLRVLRPSGTAVFLEPLGHNPFINLVRWATPAARTKTSIRCSSRISAAAEVLRGGRPEHSTCSPC